MHNKAMRAVMTDILKDITSPRQLNSLECLKLIADIIKFILTCTFNTFTFSVFVHEQSNDFRLVYGILESSQNIFTNVLILLLTFYS